MRTRICRCVCVCVRLQYIIIHVLKSNNFLHKNVLMQFDVPVTTEFKSQHKSHPECLSGMKPATCKCLAEYRFVVKCIALLFPSMLSRILLVFDYQLSK